MLFQGLRNSAVTGLILEHEEVFAESVDADIKDILDVPRDPAGFPVHSLDGPIDALCAAYRADKNRLEAALAEKDSEIEAAKREGELAAKVLKKVKVLQNAVDGLTGGKDDAVTDKGMKRIIADELEKEDGVITKGFAELRELIDSKPTAENDTAIAKILEEMKGLAEASATDAKETAAAEAKNKEKLYREHTIVLDIVKKLEQTVAVLRDNLKQAAADDMEAVWEAQEKITKAIAKLDETIAKSSDVQ